MSFFFDKSNSIFIKSAQSEGEKYKAENDPALQMAKNQGQQAEALSEYEEQKGEVKGLLRSYGLNEADIKFVESLKLPKDLLLKMTQAVIKAVNDSGLSGQFDNWFKLATQSYFNSRNWTITEQLLTSASELQGKYISLPILGSILSAVQGKTNSDIFDIMNAAFADNQADANTFRSIMGLAQLSPKSSEEEAYFAYKQMSDQKQYQADLTERAKGLTDMLQSAPYLAQEARMLQMIRTFYEGANATAPIRGWRGVLRALNMGQNIVSQGKSMISGAGPEEAKKIKSSNDKNIKIAIDKNTANLIQDFVKNWSNFYSAANTAINFIPNGKQISQGLKIIDQSVDILSTVKFDNTPQDEQKINQALSNLSKSQEYIPQVQSAYQQQLQQNMQKTNVASNNTRSVLAQDYTNLGKSLGTSLGGGSQVGVLALAVPLLFSGDYNRAFSMLGASIMAMMNTYREANGTGQVGGLNPPETLNQQNAIKALNISSGESELMSKYKAMIDKFNNDQNNFKELIETTKASAVSIGAGQASPSAGVLGSPTQVYLTYQKVVAKLQYIINISDIYLAKFKTALTRMEQNKASLKQPGQSDQDVEYMFTYLDNVYLSVSNTRMKAIAFYNEIYSISKIADKIQQENQILQKFKAIDTQAKGISKVLGPGALQQVLLGENGIFDRVQKIRQLEVEAKNKLTDELRIKQKMLQNLKKINQTGGNI